MRGLQGCAAKGRTPAPGCAVHSVDRPLNARIKPLLHNKIAGAWVAAVLRTQWRAAGLVPVHKMRLQFGPPHAKSYALINDDLKNAHYLTERELAKLLYFFPSFARLILLKSHSCFPCHCASACIPRHARRRHKACFNLVFPLSTCAAHHAACHAASPAGPSGPPRSGHRL